jgi:hypothetical protein
LFRDIHLLRASARSQSISAPMLVTSRSKLTGFAR